MYIQELWRYPVKSMAGERLEGALVSENGIEGDRVLQVQNKDGRTVTSRTFPGLLGLHASTGVDGTILVDGRQWDDPAVLADVQHIVGPGARLVRDESVDRFDILPLLVATDGAIAEFGRDVRRLRPNIVVGGVAGMEERQWQGGSLTVGNGEGSAVVIGMHDLRGRCIMTTFDPDTLGHDPGVLRDIVKRFGGKLALNCEVLRGGSVQVGQDVAVSMRDSA